MSSSPIEELEKGIEKLETGATVNPEDVKACEASIRSIVETVYVQGGLEKDEKARTTMNQMLEKKLLKSILYHMPDFSPKSRQDIKNIWLIALKSEAMAAAVDDYMRASPELLILLIRGYTKADMVQTFGDILRACIKHEAMLYLILFSPMVWQFFNFVTAEEYEKSADAFKTFKAMLTRAVSTHKKHVAKFLKEHFKQFFTQFRRLLTDERYHVKRQSLRLLSEVLQARENFSVMVKFISQPSNLELMISHLCQTDNQKKGIKSESFHVFKFFVANPKKPKEIVAVLVTHKEKLLKTLTAMTRDGSDYGRELPLLIQRLKELP
uniref:Calcium-binding protein 39 n=1 Tax=Lotharella globosa TaxID=91324 RepID=A0A6V3RZG8_9EUKA|mmetsp:Transcript_3607/g.7308  ORF Transcript_3607/g.7308 Transcript_3607/m.7308 type:complete len:324 (+) Transcript_3607:47-1018(+)|eukprot:CAMPEP_0167795564 /NCGR_PEP_ID=MMETSP0111_2-20121227/14516_1 /TAXON_ID=91324 /ORGANISM="Lotharella globosa, Strain CCCM811" /LENGTH=323 /DNA_ID=CAMNT_0007689267 /DNA_START=25 /DNA_END=996 /DNA_ORIENTATION=-